ncbi:hypothetical protein B0H14DRAFT_1419408 [Mycena olivaceomarginata]|nr:hypothetical protein B0H14DRAFT_1419408 [Mycena olivaceomarginata]
MRIFLMPLPEDSLAPLNVAVVGAGIGGLATAIALRRNGHHIRIFEASQIKTEIGAGVGLQRNVLRILKHFGYSRENLKPVNFDGLIVFDAETGDSKTLPWLVIQTDENHDLSCHRSDLHDELKRLAIGEDEGPPAELLLDSKIVSCDPEAGTLTLASGKIFHADLVIGADGVHSTIRTSILGHETKSPASEWSCFRCLFKAPSLHEIPELDWLMEGFSGARNVAWRGGGPWRMFFIYKCRSGTLINFVGFYTDSKQGDPDWTPAASREEILETFQGFHPKFLRILDLPVESTPMKWQLRVTPFFRPGSEGARHFWGMPHTPRFPSWDKV